MLQFLVFDRSGPAHGARAARAATPWPRSRRANRALLELALPVSRRWNLFLYGSVAEIEYDGPSAGFFGVPEAREDTLATATASVVFTTHTHGYFTSRYAWIDRDVDPSSMAGVEYDRHIVSTGYTWHW